MTSKYNQYRVLDDMILVEIDPEGSFTEGGIYLPNTDEKSRRDTGKETGRIRAIGDYAFKEMEGVTPKIGDIVLFKRYSGIEVNKKLDGSPWYRVMNDKDVLLIIDKE